MATSLEQASHHARLVTGLLECTCAMTCHREPCEAVTRLVTGLLQPRIRARLVTGLLEASTRLVRTHEGRIIATYAGSSLVQASNKPPTSLASMRGLLQACWARLDKPCAIARLQQGLLQACYSLAFLLGLLQACWRLVGG